MTLSDTKRAIAAFYPAWDDALFDRLIREFELPLHKKIKTLSQGMRTKFALALALAHDADLLILDEPTTGLDPVFRRERLHGLSGLLQDERRSILFSTHITSDLDRIADYITFVQNGRLISSTTRDEVIERWALVKGGVELLTDETRRLFTGVVTHEFGFIALTSDVGETRTRLAGKPVVIEQATLEDIVPVVEWMLDTDPMLCSLPVRRATIVRARYVAAVLSGGAAFALWTATGRLLGLLIGASSLASLAGGGAPAVDAAFDGALVTPARSVRLAIGHLQAAVGGGWTLILVLAGVAAGLSASAWQAVRAFARREF